MKFKYLMVATVALLFAACSNNEDEIGIVTPPDGTEATLKIKLSNPVMSRAAEGEFNDDDQSSDYTSDRITLADAMIFITDLGGKILNHYHVGTTSELTNGKFYPTKTNARRVFVLGNVGGESAYNTALGTITDNSTTIDQIQAKVTVLSSIDQDGGSGAKLFVAGYSDELAWQYVSTDQNVERWESKVSITLEPIAVKLNVTVTNNQKNYSNDPSDSYVLQDISLLYSAVESHMIADLNVTDAGVKYAVKKPSSYTKDSEYYTSGLATGWNTYNSDTTALKYYTAINNTQLRANWGFTGGDGAGNPADQVKKHTFYAYAGAKDAGKPMVVTARASTTVAGKDENVYFSVLLDASDGLSDKDPKWASNGRCYRINITLKGDAKTGGGGTVDPEKPVVEGFVEIKVEEAKWQVVTIDKTFE